MFSTGIFLTRISPTQSKHTNTHTHTTYHTHNRTHHTPRHKQRNDHFHFAFLACVAACWKFLLLLIYMLPGDLGMLPSICENVFPLWCFMRMTVDTQLFLDFPGSRLAPDGRRDVLRSLPYYQERYVPVITLSCADSAHFPHTLTRCLRAPSGPPEFTGSILQAFWLFLV